ncbi:MAG: FAD-dependent protein [archaeon]
MYDSIIIGAGPAGLFAAYKLIGKKVLLIEKGYRPKERAAHMQEKRLMHNGISNIMSGVGGAGLFSDGKLNFIPTLGKTDLTQFMDKNQAQALIDETEAIFNRFGMDGDVYPTNMDEALNIKTKAKMHDIDLLIIKQKHLGSDKLPDYMENMLTYLEQNGIEVKTGENVVDFLIENNQSKGIKTKTNIYYSNNIIAAPGRVGSKWLYQKAKDMNLKVKYRAVEVGVRIEMPKEILDKITDVIYDPTFFIQTPTYDDTVRTFCTNKQGFVAQENYDDFVCVNGHAEKKRKSNASNFAFLSKVELTEPIDDTYKYGKSICKLANTIGGGKPIIQRLGDLKRGRRSTWNRIQKCGFEPTLKDVTPGDISMALPKRIVTNLVEGLDKMDKIIPGIANNSTLLYAPEIKFFSTQIETNKQLETSIQGLFVAGDGAGVSGNIVGAAATGILAAEGVKKRLNTSLNITSL